MAFCLEDYVAPKFEYQLTKESEVQRLDYYDAAQAIQIAELKLKKEYMVKAGEGFTLDEFAIEIAHRVICDVFSLPEETSMSTAKALMSQFVSELQKLENTDEEAVKN